MPLRVTSRTGSQGISDWFMQMRVDSENQHSPGPVALLMRETGKTPVPGDAQSQAVAALQLPGTEAQLKVEQALLEKLLRLPGKAHDDIGGNGHARH